MQQPELQFASSKQIIAHRGRTLTAHHRTWWGPIWRGLAVEPAGKHYRAMRTSLWLYIYLVIHADRRTGKLTRLLPTIARDMGVKLRTVRQWLAVLKKHGYVITTPTGRALQLTIAKWKPLRGHALGDHQHKK